MDIRLISTKGLIATAAILAAALPATANAATANGSLSVSATVTKSCSLSTTAVAFGNVDPLSGSNVDATGGVAVTCTNGTAWSAAAGTGTGTGATFASRKMASGVNLLNYTLYTDAARTAIWGDGTASTALVSNTGSGASQSFVVYGRVPTGQNTAITGAYADAVAVTITY